MKINQAALNALLYAEDGPVGLEVQRKALEVRDAARQNVYEIMHRVASVSLDVQMEQHGTTAVVGIEDGGPISRYLADKQANPKEEGAKGNWLRNAVADVFPPL